MRGGREQPPFVGHVGAGPVSRAGVPELRRLASVAGHGLCLLICRRRGVGQGARVSKAQNITARRCLDMTAGMLGTPGCPPHSARQPSRVDGLPYRVPSPCAAGSNYMSNFFETTPGHTVVTCENRSSHELVFALLSYLSCVVRCCARWLSRALGPTGWNLRPTRPLQTTMWVAPPEVKMGGRGQNTKPRPTKPRPDNSRVSR